MKPYWFTEEGIKKVEKLRNATYMGPWCVKTKNDWSETPVEVFYQENPNVEAGHSHYFGIFRKITLGTVSDDVYITNAESAFSVPITGILDNDEVVVSRYCHDFVDTSSGFIDGGRDYVRFGSSSDGSMPTRVKVTVDGSEFKFEVLEDAKV